jgi:hypothetical protein
MKVTALWVLTMPLVSSAQQGLFLSAADFKNTILSYSAIGKTRYKWNLHEVLALTYITLHIGTSKYTIPKDSIYGYRNQEGTVYRYFRNIPYEILNPTEELLLYRQYSINSKGAETTFTYSFSATANDSIIPLTLYNLKTVFSNDWVLYELIDLHFKQDKDLLTYDFVRKEYVINRIIHLAQTIRTQYSLKRN